MSDNAPMDMFELPKEIKNDPKALREVLEAKPEDVQAVVDRYTKPKDPVVEEKPVEPAVEKPAEVVPIEEKPVEDYKFIFTTDSGVTLRFKTQDELAKHIASQQKVIERFNGERSQFGTLKQKNETLEKQIQEMNSKLQQIEQQRAQVPQAPVGPQQQVENDLIRQLSEKITQLESRQVASETTTHVEKERAVWEANFKSTVSEVNSISDLYPSLKTGMPWDKINDIAVNKPSEYAALVPPDDQARFEKTLEVLKYRYETTPDGGIDITRPKLSQRAALAAWRAESGEDALASTTLKNSTATATIDAITRAANKSPSLPPTAPAQPSTAAIANIDEAKRVLDAAQKNPAGYARNPELSRKVREAQIFINSLQL